MLASSRAKVSSTLSFLLRSSCVLQGLENPPVERCIGSFRFRRRRPLMTMSAATFEAETKWPVPEVKETKIVLDAFLKVRSEKLLLPDGKTMDYLTVLSRPAAVVIMALTPENKLVLTQEYRHPTRKYLLSSPGGLVDANEDPLVAAARELLEETGFEAERFAVIGESWPAPGIMDQKVIYVVAEKAVPKRKPVLERGEMLHTCLRSLKEVRQEISAGMPTDGILLTGLWFLELNYRSKA